MPSKKQSSKSQSRLSSADRSSPSPETPDSDSSEEELRRCAKQAAARFPALIGDAPLIGQVCAVQPQDSKKCEIWLSDSAIGSSYLRPGSLVSVSLAPAMKLPAPRFPLCSLAQECSRSYGFDAAHHNFADDQAGDYFVLATLNSSTKVMKNEVRLSSKLSYSMGSPASGRVVFIFPIKYPSMDLLQNGTDKECQDGINHLEIYKCRELCLDLARSNTNVKSNSDEFSRSAILKDKAESRNGNGFLSSPKTPLNQIKLHSQSVPQSPPAVIGEPIASKFDDSVITDLLASASANSLVHTWFTSWLSSRILLTGNIVEIPFSDVTFFFRVVRAYGLSVNPGKGENGKVAANPANSAYLVDRETEVNLRSSLVASQENSCDKHLLLLEHDVDDTAGHTNRVEKVSTLGGLSKEYAILKDVMVSSSAENTLSSFGLRTTKGVLLHGPPGTGKTSLVQQCVNDAGVKIFTVNGPEIVSQYYGESEKALNDVFDSASRALPAVVFIDELDAIAPARKDGGEELSQRMVATLLNLMDGISRSNGLLVVAATNRPEIVEPALRRPGRLDREIEIGVPSPEQRADILQKFLKGIEHSLSDNQVWQIAMSTHGYVGADLASLCNEAALVCLRRTCTVSRPCLDDRNSESSEASLDDDLEGRNVCDSGSSSGLSYQDSAGAHMSNGKKEAFQNDSKLCQNGFPSENITSTTEDCVLKVAFDDFEKARVKVRPSAMREVVLEVPKVSWEDVGGQEEVKTQLMEAVEWPQKHQDALKRIGTRPPTGILLFGPPGCSKTLLARAVASEAGLNFLAVKGPELFSKWVGESEKAVRSLFAKARANAPAIIFFDEIDGLAVIRGKESDGVSVSDRVMSQLLVELDGLHERVNVTVIAATNRPDKIDSALLRPGRFDRLLYVGPPNAIDREAIFNIHLRKTSCASDVSAKELASLAEGCTGADISLICREAAIAAMEENIDTPSISMRHFRAAIDQVTPSESQSYEDLSAKFQRLVQSSARSDLVK